MKHLFNKMFKYFAEGLLIVLPFTCTILFIIYSLSKFQECLLVLIRYIPFLSHLTIFPGLNIFIVLLTISLIGYMSSNFIVSYLIHLMEHILIRIPILGLVYSYTKESASGLLGKFDTPVLVTINEALQTGKVGFLTQKDLKNLDVQDKVAVYLPYAYSFSGETLIVSSKHIKVLKGISSTDLFRFTLTGGLAEIKQPLMVHK